MLPWQVAASDLLLGEELGEGGQATVVSGMWNGVAVAVKQPRAPRGASKKNLTNATAHLDSFAHAVRREARALHRVRHPNVVKLHGLCFEPTPMVIMAYAEGGTLQDALDDNKFQSNSEIIRLLAGIGRGMEAVHAHKIVHLDLKPENVLIGPRDVPWITDFGLSTSSNMASMSQSSAGGRGTLPFKAPELLSHPPVVSQAADVYAFSILAWIVVTGEQPYETMESVGTSLMAAVLDGVRPTLADKDEDWHDGTTRTIAELIEAMWDGEHRARPSFGAAADGTPGIVGRLEKMDMATAKASNEDAQLSLVTRLIALETERDEAATYIGQIDEALDEAREGSDGTKDTEAKELADERAGVETSKMVAAANAMRAKEQMAKGQGGDDLIASIMSMLDEMRELKAQVQAHETSFAYIAKDELACPRLFVFLPETDGNHSLLHRLMRPKDFVVDTYRLIFLDAVTGYATPTGPPDAHGRRHGYRIRLPKDWLVENLPYINAGMQMVKMAAAVGRLSGLPIPYEGLPTTIVAAAELQALDAFEELVGSAHEVDLGSKKAKSATGVAYKRLRQILANECKDTELMHCSLEKVRSPRDGSLEWVAPQSKARFLSEGQRCLVWNSASVTAAKPAADKKKKSGRLETVAQMAAGLTGKALEYQ